MSKVKSLILIFFLMFLISCSSESKVHLSENYPRVDGSTANMPMMASIRASFLNESKDEAENNTSVTTTDYAWRNLVEGNADLLLVYEPSEETKKIIENSGVKLKITPIGVDALVFIVNEDNVIENLSTEQIRDIYTNKITNWKELGGEDKKIEAYQRVLNSGSQTLFLNLVMNGIKPADPPISYQIEGMDGLIERIAEYNESSNAIGYSVFYYAKKMYEVPGLKLLSVDGVMPTDETIKNKEYPYLNEYYLVIREDTKEDSETMELYNYILSKNGKKAMIEAGYIPTIMDIGEMENESTAKVINESDKKEKIEVVNDTDENSDYYSNVTSLNKNEVENIAKNIKEAYMNNDFETLSGIMQYPIYYDIEVGDFSLRSRGKKISTEDEFLEVTKNLFFTYDNISLMEEDNCENLNIDVASGGISIGSGLIYMRDVNFNGVEMKMEGEPLFKIFSLSGVK